MKGDLISRSALIEQVKSIHRAVDTTEINQDYDTGFHSATSQIMGLIEFMPTAYDVEKVVAELDKEEIALEDNYGDYVLCVPTRVVEEIVRNGGKE